MRTKPARRTIVPARTTITFQRDDGNRYYASLLGSVVVIRHRWRYRFPMPPDRASWLHGLGWLAYIAGALAIVIWGLIKLFS